MPFQRAGQEARWRARPMNAMRIVALVIVALALWPASVLGQDLPPGPMTVHPLGRMPLQSGPGRFEEAQSLILDFAPGAWTPLHSHGGLTLVRVLEGEMTRRAHGVDDLFRAGEGWVEAPGDIHAAGNAGTALARVLVTFLLPAGAALTMVEGTPSQAAPPGPTTTFQSRRVEVTTPAADFDEAATTVLGFAPGTWTPLHSHGGLTLVAVVEGEMTVRSGGRETVYRVGDLWIEPAGDVHAAGNATETDARVAVTFLLRRGAPVTTVTGAQAPAQTPRALPRTGELGSIAPPLAGIGIALAGVGYGVLRARRA
jgi:LPXTG-motif cell wall-anchored protein